MKVALIASALVAAVSAGGVRIDYDTLLKESVVKFDKYDCGKWKKYKCCARKEDCDQLKDVDDFFNKKEEKKATKARDKHCVPEDETCCGADIYYNWKSNDKTKDAVEYDTDAGKNVKKCEDKDDLCVVDHLLSHSDNGKYHEAYLMKSHIGSKASTKCVKKEDYKKKQDKSKTSYAKKVEKGKKKIDKVFSKDKKIGKFGDKGYQCGNFETSVFKCCSPDKHFCEQIGADDKDKYCVKKEDECCQNFEYAESNHHVIKLVDMKDEMGSCKKGSDEDTCVVTKHDSKKKKVEVKCVDPKA